jgi:5,10-methylenetetrahydromethanopterin reductase
VITGIQLHGWTRGPALLECLGQAADRLDTVWLSDQLQSRSTAALLGALAATTRYGVGTAVTFPFGRNPLELASTMATLTEFVESPRQVTMGVGTGGGLVSALMTKEHPVERVRELILLCRALWRGENVSLDDYPLTQSAGGFHPGARAALSFCQDAPVRVVLAGVGPKVLEMAGEVADGVICASNFPSHSLAAFRSGRFDDVSNLQATDRGRLRSDRPHFTRIYGVNVSVGNDPEAATEMARRQAALIVSQQPEELLQQVGIDPDHCAATRAAVRSGENISVAAGLLPQHVANQLVISGSPAACIEPLQELLDYARKAGFTEAYVGAPIGPDPMEAVRLIATEILPELDR